MKINTIWNNNFLGKFVGLSKSGKLKVAVHNGTFHADDVYSIALLDLAIDLATNRLPKFVPGVNQEMANFVTIRTREESLIESSDIVIDVGTKWDGQKYFDHHQEDVPKNVIGDIPHSALGLLAEVLIVDKVILDELRKSVIFGIEARDNGLVIPEGLGIAGEWVSVFNPNWDESTDQHAAFIEAAYIAKKMLYQSIKRIASTKKAEAIVDLAAKQAISKKIMVLDEFVPWKSHVFRNYPEIECCVFLGHSGWSVVGALDISETDMHQKFYFPEGFESEGMKFLHKARFMAVFDSKVNAIRAAIKALGLDKPEVKTVWIENDPDGTIERLKKML